MSNAVTKILSYSCDMDAPLKKSYIDTLFATQDINAHQVDVSLNHSGKAATIPSGASVNAYFIRYADSTTVSLTGSISGSKASVTLNSSCYAKGGAYALIIKVVYSGVTATVFYGEGSVYLSRTDTVVVAEDYVPPLISPLNLLDNSDFCNPISQRGLTSLTGTGYMIDRWRGQFTNNTYAQTSGGVRVTTTATSSGWHWRQTINGAAHLVGKTVTLCTEFSSLTNTSGMYLGIRCNNASGEQVAYKSKALASGVVTVDVRVPDGTTSILCGIISTSYSTAESHSFVVKWAALYAEYYTAVTMPPYVAKDKTLDMLNCQRYLLVYPTIGDYITPFASGFVHSATISRFEIDLPAKMVSETPTITFDGVVCAIRTNDESYTPTAYSIVRHRGNKLYFAANATNLPSGKPCVLTISGMGSKIIISAED